MIFGSPEVANILSSIALVVSAALAIFQWRDRRNTKYQIANDFSNQLLGWHSEVVEVLIGLNLPPKEISKAQKRDLLVMLSAQIEQGRFFFPNVNSDKYGIEKPPAYRGYRNIALDFLVASYDLHNRPYTRSVPTQALQLQRLFTSVVFEVVRPSHRLKQIKKITDQYFVKNLSLDDLLTSDQTQKVDRMW
jgi:hypothetical protein